MLKELIEAAAACKVGIDDDQATQLQHYAGLIEKWSKVRNLVGRVDRSTLLHSHLIDCTAAVPFIVGRMTADVGSGAGLPGVINSAKATASLITEDVRR